MNEQMLEAIIQLVRDGGQSAVYIVIFYYGLSFAKFVVGMGILGYAISKLWKILKYGIDKGIWD